MVRFMNKRVAMAASVLLYSAGQNPVLGVGGQKNRSIGKNSEGYQELDAIIQNDDRDTIDQYSSLANRSNLKSLRDSVGSKETPEKEYKPGYDSSSSTFNTRKPKSAKYRFRFSFPCINGKHKSDSSC
ncbi:unnamed protein product [Albugo candida]|uniref:Uncharacterized protein n=1 Tax=Albugo candida TaxID=65357 RepID=A0A024FWF9_9STRA|nr:unnamed protein product [Albugo candida]|eukprot:CCI10974.1 unnamed protein product [Albugo candida]